MLRITKSIFLNTLICPTLGWLTANGFLHRTPSLGEQFRCQQGHDIGQRAQTLFPGGALVDQESFPEALLVTEHLVATADVPAIFEGAFLFDRCAVRADILHRTGHGWHLIEVKSALEDSDRYIDDMAYTAMVLMANGINISSVSLLLISRDFRRGMDNSRLFREIPHTASVLARAGDLAGCRPAVDAVLTRAEKPEPALMLTCRKCLAYHDCIKHVVPNPITDLPRISASKFSRLHTSGFMRIEDIPGTFPLTRPQTIARQTVLSGEPYIGPNLKSELDAIVWPVHYLDFEAINTAIPLYQDLQPHEVVPTQFSIHICSQPGHITGHLEYLADPARDCRKELAVQLIQDLGTSGDIFMYSNYEKRIITQLADQFPDLSRDLMDLTRRLVDLKRILEKNYYHPGFHGRASLKKVLPVMVPEMSYDDFEIPDGDSALSVFAMLAQGHFDSRKITHIQDCLLRYCEQDTLAMVKIHQRLAELV